MNWMKQIVAPVCVGAGAVFNTLCGNPKTEKLHARNWHSNLHSVYPAPNNFPNLRNNNNLMGKFLTPCMYRSLKDQNTKHGFSFDQAIQVGVDNPGKPGNLEGQTVGVVAGDEDTYVTFAPLFDQIIKEKHGGYGPDQKHVTHMDASRLHNGHFGDCYVKSCRIRTGRNLRGLSLPPHMCRAERREVTCVLTKALGKFCGEFEGKYYPLNEMSRDVYEKLIADHFLFQKPTGSLLLSSGMARDWPDSRGIWHNKAKNMLVWLNEEDHIRFICMQPGGDMKEVYERFCNGIAEMEKHVKDQAWEFQWNPHLGYITTCPSNLGTGLRCGVHIKLRNLGKHPEFQTIARRMKLQVRGTGGEHTPVVDDTYDVSNRERLGKSENQLVQLVIDGVHKLIEMEKRLENGGNINDLIRKLPSA